jgi:hypothetical protein
VVNAGTDIATAALTSGEPSGGWRQGQWRRRRARPTIIPSRRASSDRRGNILANAGRNILATGTLTSDVDTSPCAPPGTGHDPGQAARDDHRDRAAGAVSTGNLDSGKRFRHARE